MLFWCFLFEVSTWCLCITTVGIKRISSEPASTVLARLFYACAPCLYLNLDKNSDIDRKTNVLKRAQWECINHAMARDSGSVLGFLRGLRGLPQQNHDCNIALCFE